MNDPSAVVLILRRLMAPLERRLLSLASRSTLVLVDDSGTKQLVQITALASERGSKIQRLQSFGFTANPPPGCSGLLISIGGSRTHCLFIEGENGNRKKDLQTGESAQYNDFGDYILLDKDGNCRVHASTKVLIEAPEAELTGNCTVDGNLHVKGDIKGDGQITDASRSMQQIHDAFNPHTHGASGPPDTSIP